MYVQSSIQRNAHTSRYHNSLWQQFSSQHPALGEFLHVSQIEHNGNSLKRRRLLDPEYVPKMRSDVARAKDHLIQEEKRLFDEHINSVRGPDGSLFLQPQHVAHYLKAIGCPLAPHSTHE